MSIRNSLRWLALCLAPLTALVPTPLAAQVWEVGNRMLTSGIGSELHAGFGAAIAIGDFDGDGYDDLAVGEPHRTAVGHPGAGVVTIWLGGQDGLGTTHHQILQYPQDDAAFGAALAAGDFDGDGDDELVVGLPGYDEAYSAVSQVDSGFAIVYSWNGSFLVIQRTLSQSPADVASAPEPADAFGSSFAVGDFNGDLRDDLAVGVPGESYTYDALNRAGAGVVSVFYGSVSGLTNDGDQIWYVGSNISGTPASGDALGSALAAGDFDGDGRDDLAIGVPNRSVVNQAEAGVIYELFGSATGLAGAATQFDQASGGVALNLVGAHFGAALAAGDFDRTDACLATDSCRDDLAIGAPGSEGQGRIYVYLSSASGLNAYWGVELSQSDLHANLDESGDEFGSVLAAGDLGLGGASDLVQGTPEKSFSPDSAQGFVQVTFGGADAISGTSAGQRLQQRQGLACGFPKTGDHFGSALGIGDFDGDGSGDLAIGMSGRAIVNIGTAGAVEVMYGALFADGFESDSNGVCYWSSVYGSFCDD